MKRKFLTWFLALPKSSVKVDSSETWTRTFGTPVHCSTYWALTQLIAFGLMGQYILTPEGRAVDPETRRGEFKSHSSQLLHLTSAVQEIMLEFFHSFLCRILCLRLAKRIYHQRRHQSLYRVTSQRHHQLQGRRQYDRWPRLIMQPAVIWRYDMCIELRIYLGSVVRRSDSTIHGIANFSTIIKMLKQL